MGPTSTYIKLGFGNWGNLLSIERVLIQMELAQVPLKLFRNGQIKPPTHCFLSIVIGAVFVWLTFLWGKVNYFQLDTKICTNSQICTGLLLRLGSKSSESWKHKIVKNNSKKGDMSRHFKE